MNKVDVLLDKRRNEISITTIDDTTSEEVETTLSVSEAWNLVADINVALQKLALAAETRVQVVGNAKLNKDQLDELAVALKKAGNSLFSGGLISPENVSAAQAEPVIKHGGIAVHIDARGNSDPAHVEEVVRCALANAMPKSTHRPYSGTMNN